jgi:hypothetical protein
MPSPAFLALLEQLLTPILTGLVRLLAGPANDWLIDHALTFVAGHIARKVRLGPEWSLQLGLTDVDKGIVVFDVYRAGVTPSVFTGVLRPLALTAARQASLAALLGVIFAGAEQKILDAFAKVPPPVA